MDSVAAVDAIFPSPPLRTTKELLLLLPRKAEWEGTLAAAEEEEDWVLLLASAEALKSTANLKGLDTVKPLESLTRALF